MKHFLMFICGVVLTYYAMTGELLHYFVPAVSTITVLVGVVLVAWSFYGAFKREQKYNERVIK